METERIVISLYTLTWLILKKVTYTAISGFPNFLLLKAETYKVMMGITFK